MISIEEYKEIISELLDEFPSEFFRELSGGVVVSEKRKIPEYARGNDLYTMPHMPTEHVHRGCKPFAHNS